jgi:hypothetical protein
MSDFKDCAEGAINAYIKEYQPDRWPNWANVRPGGTADGWEATKPVWRDQAKIICDWFNLCVGLAIDYPVTQIDNYREQELNEFREYLVEKAELHRAKLSFQKAKNSLSAVKSSIKTFKVR